MEFMTVNLNNSERFDEILELSRTNQMPEMRDLEIVTKGDGTAKNKPIVMVTFRLKLPDGQIRRVQAVTTAICFVMAGRAVQAAHEIEL